MLHFTWQSAEAGVTQPDQGSLNYTGTDQLLEKPRTEKEQKELRTISPGAASSILHKIIPSVAQPTQMFKLRRI